jgi:hypothetical protein
MGYDFSNDRLSGFFGPHRTPSLSEYSVTGGSGERLRLATNCREWRTPVLSAAADLRLLSAPSDDRYSFGD